MNRERSGKTGKNRRIDRDQMAKKAANHFSEQNYDRTKKK